jgi:general secretion pathway protein L
VNLVPVHVLKNKKKIFWIQLALLLVFIASFSTYPLAQIMGKKQALKKIKAQSQELTVEVNRVSDLRKENKQIKEYLQNLAQEVRSKHVVPELLKEATELLPKDTWLDSFSFARSKIILRGSAPSATNVIESLENSPIFKEVRFDAPVVKKGENEIFKISCRIE